MKALKILVLILVIGVVVVGLIAPIGPLPGIFIGGNQTEVPDSWGNTKPIHEIQLSVGEGLLSRVVIIWVVQLNGELHVVGSKESGWTTKIGNGGPVRMRMGDSTYDMHAELVSTGFEDILQAYGAKYRPDYPEIIEGFPAPEEAAASTAIFRLKARS